MNKKVKFLVHGFKILCIILLLLIIFCLYRYGIVSDEYATKFSANYLWFALFSLVGILLLLKFSKVILNRYNTFHKKCKILISIFYLLIILVVINSIFSIIDTNLKLNEIINSYSNIMNNQQFISKEITLKELDYFTEKNISDLIYIKRTDCYVCTKVEPELKSFLISEELNFLYYDTVNDRENNKEYLQMVLDKYKIDSVPFLIVIENGEILKTFREELIVNELKEYLNNNNVELYQ